MIKNCDNCEHQRYGRMHPCNYCVAAIYEGGRTSDPSHWIPKAPEIVRCRECQNHKPSNVRGRVWCKTMGRYMKEDGFCSEGERRNNDHN